MAIFAPDKAHSQKTIPAGSSAGMLIYAGKAIYWGASSTSITAQQNPVYLYDAPSVSAAQSGNYQAFDVLSMGAGQDLDKSIGQKGRELTYGLVALPAGPLNSDSGATAAGGITVIFDAIL